MQRAKHHLHSQVVLIRQVLRVLGLNEGDRTVDLVVRWSALAPGRTDHNRMPVFYPPVSATRLRSAIPIVSEAKTQTN